VIYTFNGFKALAEKERVKLNGKLGLDEPIGARV
jgi:hypothetical protein